MGATSMHADEIATDAALVRRLLAGRFPQWAGLPTPAPHLPLAIPAQLGLGRPEVLADSAR